MCLQSGNSGLGEGLTRGGVFFLFGAITAVPKWQRWASLARDLTAPVHSAFGFVFIPFCACARLCSGDTLARKVCCDPQHMLHPIIMPQGAVFRLPGYAWNMCVVVYRPVHTACRRVWGWQKGCLTPAAGRGTVQWVFGPNYCRAGLEQPGTCPACGRMACQEPGSAGKVAWSMPSQCLAPATYKPGWLECGVVGRQACCTCPHTQLWVHIAAYIGCCRLCSHECRPSNAG